MEQDLPSAPIPPFRPDSCLPEDMYVCSEAEGITSGEPVCALRHNGLILDGSRYAHERGGLLTRGVLSTLMSLGHDIQTMV